MSTPARKIGIEISPSLKEWGGGIGTETCDLGIVFFPPLLFYSKALEYLRKYSTPGTRVFGGLRNGGVFFFEGLWGRRRQMERAEKGKEITGITFFARRFRTKKLRLFTSFDGAIIIKMAKGVLAKK